MTYSYDFRETVLTYKKSHTIKQICAIFNITKQTYYNWAL